MDGYAPDLSGDAPMILEFLDSHSVSYEGTREINGFSAHHIRFEQGEEEIEYWFEEDSYFTVHHRSAYEDRVTEVSVLDFELNPDLDESQFDIDQALDGDTEIIETDRESFMEAEQP